MNKHNPLENSGDWRDDSGIVDNGYCNVMVVNHQQSLDIQPIKISLKNHGCNESHWGRWPKHSCLTSWQTMLQHAEPWGPQQVHSWLVSIEMPGESTRSRGSIGRPFVCCVVGAFTTRVNLDIRTIFGGFMWCVLVVLTHACWTGHYKHLCHGTCVIEDALTARCTDVNICKSLRFCWMQLDMHGIPAFVFVKKLLKQDHTSRSNPE